MNISSTSRAVRVILASLMIAAPSAPARAAATARPAGLSFRVTTPTLGYFIPGAPAPALSAPAAVPAPTLLLHPFSAVPEAIAPATIEAAAPAPALPALFKPSDRLIAVSRQDEASPVAALEISALFDGAGWTALGALTLAAGLGVSRARESTDSRARRAAPSPAADFLASTGVADDPAAALRSAVEFYGQNLDGDDRVPPSSAVARPMLLHGNAGAYGSLPHSSWPSGLKDMAARFLLVFDIGERGDGFWGAHRRGAAAVEAFLASALEASAARLAPRETRGVDGAALTPALVGLSVMLQIALCLHLPAPLLIGAGALFLVWLLSAWSADELRLVRPKNPDDTPQARHQHALLRAFADKCREHLKNPLPGDFTFLSINSVLSPGAAALILLLHVGESGEPRLDFVGAAPSKKDLERESGYARRYGVSVESIDPARMPNPPLPPGYAAPAAGPSRWARPLGFALGLAGFAAANAALYAALNP